jgi:hypothetical protein
METKPKRLEPIPAKRYFTIEELCRLADINEEEFIHWQHSNGIIIGYGGQHYTRSDVIKVRQLSKSFMPFLDPFTRNKRDIYGNPAIDAIETHRHIESVINNMTDALAK